MKRLKVNKIMDKMKEGSRKDRRLSEHFSILDYYAGASRLLDLLMEEGFVTKNQAVLLDVEFTRAIFSDNAEIKQESATSR